jgi:hypothetical protein
MSTTYPASKQTFTDPQGTSLITSPDHAGLHTDMNDTVEKIQDTVGTTDGTNVLKDFSAGQFPVRINSGGTLYDNLTGGQWDNGLLNNANLASAVIGTSQITKGTVGTAQITGGTVANALIGTCQITGGTVTEPVIILPNSTPTTDGAIGFDRTNEYLNIGYGTATHTMRVGAWTSFTPTWTAAGGTPALGTSDVFCYYTRIGKTTTVRYKIKFGGATFQGAEWRFTLPGTAVFDGTTFANPGAALLYSGSTGLVFTAISCLASSTTLAIYSEGGTSSSSLGTTHPFTWANTAYLMAQITYEEA